MAGIEHTSDSEPDYPKGVTDAASCLDYLKKKEVFLYKMMNDPSHKAMLYFLEVLMNSDESVTIDHLAARFSHKTFSPEMREACGGGSPEGLREFLLRYPSLFNVDADGHVSSVAIELPGAGELSDGFQELECWSNYDARHSSLSNDRGISKTPFSSCDGKEKFRGCNQTATSHKPETVKSASSLSLTSATSNASSSSGSLSFYGRGKKPDKTDDPHLNQIKINSDNPNRWSSNSNGNYPNPVNEHLTYRHCDPQLPNQQCCDPIGSVAVAPISTTTCLHCPLMELACHHHHPHTACSTGHHHHHHATTTTTHCLCADSRFTCVPYCHQCHSLAAQSTQHKTTGSSTVCALPPFERLTLETEAVRFFQQRLLKRDERWVQIKSLAGHLSQARADIRAIVGPQLEFRNFLLRHPHVFEVQGELVSVRDPFGALYPTRKDRMHAIHNSFSSASLFSQGNSVLTGYPRNVRLPRPKSLVLPDTQTTNFSAFQHTRPQPAEFHAENKRSSQMCDNGAMSWYTKQSANTNSAPNTPTGFSQSTAAEARAPGQQSKRPSFFGKSNHSSSSLENSVVEKATEHLAGSKSVNSLSIAMSANEYRSVMFVRKVLEKRGGASNQPGLPFCELLQILSEKSPESVHSTIGWTKVEVEEFLKQHRLFFEIALLPSESSSSISQISQSNKNEDLSLVVVRNKRLEKMINIVITGTKAPDSNLRCLTNHCGRIYHVTKLWGIIDLGKHEHVFFDKSLFKHIDDLQKYFKVDETLYFNAILAPKESRAKWRATQVWKECDREAVEKMNVHKSTSEAIRSSVAQNRSKSFGTSENNQSTSGHQRSSTNLKTRFSEYAVSNEDEDTEADGEIEEIDVEGLSLTDLPNKISSKTQSKDDSDCEFALTGEEDIEEEAPLLSTVAREEGLQLINDVKFITDNHDQSKYNESHVADKRQPVFKHTETKKPNDHHDYELNNVVSSSTENTTSECNSSLQSVDCSCDVSCRQDITKSVSSSESCSISIAVQTVSTGDIMATHLYHDQNRQSCPSGC